MNTFSIAICLIPEPGLAPTARWFSFIPFNRKPSYKLGQVPELPRLELQEERTVSPLLRCLTSRLTFATPGPFPRSSGNQTDYMSASGIWMPSRSMSVAGSSSVMSRSVVMWWFNSIEMMAY